MEQLIRNNRANNFAFLGWAALTIIVVAMLISGNPRAFDPSYRTAALNWLSGKDLYDGTGVGGFVYFPQAVILFIPFALLPKIFGEVLWRVLSMGVLVFGTYRFTQFVGDKYRVKLFPLMSLVSIPLAWDCARNGQSTLIMMGMMLLAVVDTGRGRWWRAVLWFSLGMAFKPLIIVLLLLVMAVYRPLSWRLLLGMIALFGAPFITQSSDYVFKQYLDCLQNMTKAVQVGVVVSGWTSPFNVLRLMQLEVPEQIQMLIRIVAALGTLVLSYMIRQRFDAVRSITFIYSLATLYLMLFSPRTENNTYAMLGPVISVFLANAVFIERKIYGGILLGLISLCIVSHRFFERLLLPRVEPTWISPLMAMIFSVYVLMHIFNARMMSREMHGLGADGRNKVCSEKERSSY